MRNFDQAISSEDKDRSMPVIGLRGFKAVINTDNAQNLPNILSQGATYYKYRLFVILSVPLDPSDLLTLLLSSEYSVSAFIRNVI
jgi:hypothetical protein